MTEGSDEVCNGQDGDCDGSTDEGYISAPTTCGLGVCAREGDLICERGATRDTCVCGADFGVCDSLDALCSALRTAEGDQSTAILYRVYIVPALEPSA